MLIPSPLFGSGAVLCRDKDIRVFGRAEDGARVRVTLTDASGRTLADASAPTLDGRFLVTLPRQGAQTGCTLRFDCGGEQTVSEDVAIGDVYLAGGQSNMELELQNADEGAECIASHRDAQLRYFNVPKRAMFTEEAERANAEARWVAIAPGTGRDMSAVAYFFARRLREKLDVPVGVIDCYWGGTSVTAWMDEEALRATAEGTRYLDEYAKLVGDKTEAAYLAEEEAFQREMQAWNDRVAALKAEQPGITWPEINREAGECPWHPPVGCGSPYRPGGLAETMLKRVVPATLTGALFYQGEDDAGRTTCYDVLLASMVVRWRALFRDETLPFLNVQLPMWIAAGAQEDGNWPRVRRAQERVWKTLRHTGLAVTIDCGEYDNIHPTDKRTVGERLAEQAMRVVYGRPGEESPRAVSMTAAAGEAEITLSAPVRALDGNPPALLEAAGWDGVYHPAQGRVEGALLRVTSPDVPEVVSVRYAWVDWGKVNLFGENGLPLAPFLLP